MSTEDDQRITRTPVGVIAFACLMGALGAYSFGIPAVIAAGFGNLGGDLGLLAVMNYVLAGAASGVSFVGLCGLFGGAKLGRYFSYPLVLSLSGFSGVLLRCFLDWCDVEIDEEMFASLWFVWIVLLGGVGGTVLARGIGGYRRRSRVWAVVGVILMLPVVGFALCQGAGEDIFIHHLVVVLFLFGTLSILVFGGVLGAVVGAISDRRNRHRVRADLLTAES
ncbi:MAG: hypothetical protein QGH60_02360 [Phycisphaerae bacterium]|jgi:hypothetical protein|nr:hypothetical protein [Phycisphaerae bacterium]